MVTKSLRPRIVLGDLLRHCDISGSKTVGKHLTVMYTPLTCLVTYLLVGGVSFDGFEDIISRPLLDLVTKSHTPEA